MASCDDSPWERNTELGSADLTTHFALRAMMALTTEQDMHHMQPKTGGSNAMDLSGKCNGH